MDKTKVIFERWSPHAPGANYVAIQTETNPPYVWNTYFAKDEIPSLPDDIVVIPTSSAKKLLDFEEGKIDEIQV